MRIVFVQAGDYKEAADRFAQGLGEAYSNQKYSVDWVADLAIPENEVIVVCIRAQPYDAALPTGVRTIGIDEHAPDGQAALLDLIKSLNPTHLIARTPNAKLIKQSLSMGAQVLPIFADSFSHQSLRRRWRQRPLIRVLNDPRIQIISNHNLNASRSLCSAGVDPSKVVPYDYARPYTPDQYTPKDAPKEQRKINMLFVGVASQQKGIFDVLDAIPKIIALGINPTLTIVGKDQSQLAQRIKDLNIESHINLLGTQPNTKVIALMREHDAVIVPSRPTYPEGLPHTIFESLATRTPLIASDHPMFTPMLTDEHSCVMFEAGNPDSIANATHRLLTAPGLYQRISANTPAVWDQLVMPFVWHEIIEFWLSGSSSEIEKLQKGSVHQLKS